ncbi:hypothetical protein CKM354_001294900 [Cercospora kikuchii]|uniref:Uncharacterized protein n=1 Tax=Cercospora kikuchii TaxID=84275 RepID=A0A9P3L2G9_9PEZI|nr:uncharacterized protein CKM354_001294900 [Cercospora kikuchii]GIZ49933.1 hypothetical protein CKM354_001294900 [Cercospora kikuchii]
MFLLRLAWLAVMLTAHLCIASTVNTTLLRRVNPSGDVDGRAPAFQNIFTVSHSSNQIPQNEVCDDWFSPHPDGRGRGRLVAQWSQIWHMNSAAISRLRDTKGTTNLARAFLGTDVRPSRNPQEDQVQLDVLDEAEYSFKDVGKKMDQPSAVKPIIVCGTINWLWWVDLIHHAQDEHGEVRKDCNGKPITIREYEESQGTRHSDIYEHWWFWARGEKIGHDAGYVLIPKSEFPANHDGSPPFELLERIPEPEKQPSEGWAVDAALNYNFCKEGESRTFTIAPKHVRGRPEMSREVEIIILCPEVFKRFSTDHPGSTFPPTMPTNAKLGEYGMNALSLYRELVRASNKYGLRPKTVMRRISKEHDRHNTRRDFPGFKNAWDEVPGKFVEHCLSAMYLSLYDVAEKKSRRLRNYLAVDSAENLVWFALATYYEQKLKCDFSNGVRRPAGSRMQEVTLAHEVVP